MAFKYEKIDEALRTQIYEEEVALQKAYPSEFFGSNIKHITMWCRDYENNIIMWARTPSMMEMRDDYYQEHFWIKFMNKLGDNICSFTLLPGVPLVSGEIDNQNQERLVAYTWEKILSYRLCKDISFEKSLSILKNGLLPYGGDMISNKFFPKFSVDFNF